MERVAKACVQSLLKIVNSILGVVGIAMIVYGLWMIRATQIDSKTSVLTFPWFICSFLVTGVCLCLVTCIGHIAAVTSNRFCLFCYKLLIILLLLLETAIASDILLNSDWEKDFPKDPTGRFRDFEDFVDSNFDIFEWIVFFIIMAQVISMLLAVALRSMSWNSNYDSDEECQVRHPLIINHHTQPPPYVIGCPQLANSKNDACYLA